jgi:hypothetical protein
MEAPLGSRPDWEPTADRFGAASAGVKCTRIGGAGGVPRRGEITALLASQPPSPVGRPGAKLAGLAAHTAKGLWALSFSRRSWPLPENIFLCKA